MFLAEEKKEKRKKVASRRRRAGKDIPKSEFGAKNATTARSIRRQKLVELQLDLNMGCTGTLYMPIEVGNLKEGKDNFPNHIIKTDPYNPESLSYPIDFYLTNKSSVGFLRSQGKLKDGVEQEPSPVLEMCLLLPSQRNPDFSSPIDALVPSAGQSLTFTMHSDVDLRTFRYSGVVEEVTYLGARHAGRRMADLKLRLMPQLE